MRNHPILFLGTGFSLRYLKQSYTWYDLLKRFQTICMAIQENFWILLIRVMSLLKISESINKCKKAARSGFILQA